MIDLTTLTMTDVVRSITRRERSTVEVTTAALDRIKQLNDKLRALITVVDQPALQRAEELDRLAIRRNVARMPLLGVPIVIKDSFWTRGIRTTAGSKILADFVPTEDASVVERLTKAGAIIVGKGSLHEFAYGFTNRNPHHGDCRNPWDTTRIPGGSSGGNAVALATGMALGAVGGDTGGSIRLPAGLCSVVGLKVTYGRVSRYGGIPLSWSLDTVGPMTRTVADAARMLNAMAGHDSKDPSTRQGPVPDYAAELGGDLKGLRVGVPHDRFLEAVDPEVGAAMQAALGALKQVGATLVDVKFPPLDAVIGAHRAVLFSEASAAHETMVRERGDELSDDVRPLLQAGLFLTSAHYLAGRQTRLKTIAEYRALWKDFDVLVTPASPIPAPTIGETTTRLDGKDTPLVRAFLDLTCPFNLTGQPGLVVPAGLMRAGMPIGMQLVGRPWDEGTLLRVGSAFERATEWHRKRPTLIES
jgi:aspartyl-tRNA(Asn)/glutamyl-tRNA(Gln) amidotransferase subunit A